MHHTLHEPLFFGPPPGAAPQGRWDAPAGEYRVCYLAEEAHLAFAETFLRSPGVPYVHRGYLAERSLARIQVLRDLQLVALHGPGLARIGATAAVVSGLYALTRAWSGALHAHPAAPDGIRYRARHDDDGFAVALFDRAADAVAERERQELLDRTNTIELATWLDRYGTGLL
ncbi:MAG TPA: RES family NAD+ phosphorylase [Longimicrobiaceae bacterium]|nr:RES family NAD+ phosphorylase [Longimicrobiaceae bacterium]